MAEREARPSPEALLDAAKHEGRGCLKVFLGAAPGVGKTYEMLLSAQAVRGEGADVVVGVVETHGRRETEALLEGLEIIPRREVDYKGHRLAEMDLDAILKRRPQLVLVDELAHTNAPGSRHPKRYLDVEELIAAGIDVYTTLNIQHVESLNDVVARITRIRVRETVPDGILDHADDVEVIDLSPDDLIKRLREGKVYIPHQAERAIRHYFQPGNLTALRELALRQTAQRVDDQLLSHMRAHAIAGPWAAGDRVLVCVSEAINTPGLIRYSRRIADRLHAPLTAIYVETARTARLSDAERDRIAEYTRLAERLGASTITIPGRKVADEVVAYAEANNITQIVIGKSSRPLWFEIVHGSVVHDLVRKTGSISVHVISAEQGQPPQARPVSTRASAEPFQPWPYLGSAGAVALALGVGEAIGRSIGVQSISLVFLMAVLASAIAWGLLPALVACVLSVLTYNFFFLPPLYTFTIADPENVVALIFFLLVAVIVSNLTAAARRQIVSARLRAKITAELYAFSRKLAGIGTLDDLLWATAYQVSSMLRVHTVLLLPEQESGRLQVASAYPPEDRLDEADMAAAQWCWEHNHPTGRGSDTLPGGKWLFLPLRTGSGPVGVIGIERDSPGPLLTPDERRLLDALNDQAAVAIERVSLVRRLAEERVRAESDRLRAALLTSISHDLRTPLASILGTVSSLRSYADKYGAADRDELLASLESEAERMNRFVGNLLDMTRLESGTIETKLDLVDVAEIVGAAIERAGNVLAHHRVDVTIASDLPMLRLDPILFEQVLFNLLDNAAKYAPAGSRIDLRARQEGDTVAIEVVDEGPGIPPGDLERVFDKFYRVQAQDRRRAGTGLGLAICRGFIEAQGGRIEANNRRDRSGAVLTIRLPVPERVEIREPVAADG
ncbi:MAG: sensor histidine kinase KdpD [Alphaproteobacteria bacterium]|nr:sensor histidine kinase KdpD [Alphaproteobacteria bacterium]